MKTPKFQRMLAVAFAGGLGLLALKATAQESTNTPPAPQLSYSASEILKLAQAKVGEDTIIAYIKASRSGYTLSAAQILYLRQQGASDTVITTMLNQPKPEINMAGAPALAAPAQPVAAPYTPPAAAPQTSTVVVPPSVTYVQSAPPAYSYYYPSDYYYPAYGYSGYYGWPIPGVALSFGFGGRFGGGFRGGGFGFHGGHR